MLKVIYEAGQAETFDLLFLLCLYRFDSHNLIFLMKQLLNQHSLALSDGLKLWGNAALFDFSHAEADVSVL